MPVANGRAAEAQFHSSEGAAGAARPDARPAQGHPDGVGEQEPHHPHPGGRQREAVQRSERHKRENCHGAHRDALRRSRADHAGHRGHTPWALLPHGGRDAGSLHGIYERPQAVHAAMHQGVQPQADIGDRGA